MSAPAIYNPVIPCVQPIPGGLFPGRMIRFQGNIPPGAQRFAINLQCGPNTDPRDDIALHLNFRFVEMCVVRNHLTAMSWGAEDTSGGMPLVRGEAFEALVLCDAQSIKIALNGAHFCEFPHRVPFQRISHFTVDGDVMMQFIGFEGAQVPPQQQMYMAEPPAYGSYGAPPPAYGAPGYGAPQGHHYGAHSQSQWRGQPPGQWHRPQYSHQAQYNPAMANSPGYGYRANHGSRFGGGMQSYEQTAAYAAPAQQRRGMGTGAAVGLGVGALAAGGLAGYALGGGFSSDSPEREEVQTVDVAEFGGDDWME